MLDAKRKISVISALLIIVTIVFASFAIYLKQNPDMVAYETQAQKIFNHARGEVEDIRNVTLPTDITLMVYTKQQAVDRWGKGGGDPDLVNIHRQENIYKGLFMMSEDASLYEAAAEWTANWAAATLGNEIYVIKENFDPWDMPSAEATLVHELTHVWEPDLVSPTTFDTDKAHTALVEGDSSYMGEYFKSQYNTHASPANFYGNSVPICFIDNPSLNGLRPSTPDTVSNLNWFPYVQGKTFVTTLIDNGGWARLNLAYEPDYTPSTTEQILHANKYFSNESALPTNAPTLTDDTWTLIQTSRRQNSDSYGEYFIQVMLSNWLKNKNENEALNASAGWGGDNFTYYEKSNDFLFTWNITWDSANDASEFQQAFTHMMTYTGATNQGSNEWYANGKYLTLMRNQTSAATLIACSTNQAAVQPTNFT
jgi:hypothetical protein